MMYSLRVRHPPPKKKRKILGANLQEADHSPPYTAEVKNEWSHTSNPPYTFSVKHNNILLLSLLATFTFMLSCIVIDFFLNNQPDALIIPNLFCYKTLHVSGSFCAHHQEFSTVHSALVSFMQIQDVRGLEL